MSGTCLSCGAVEDAEASFTPRVGLFGPRRVICPECVRRETRRVLIGFTVAEIGLGAASVAWLVLQPESNAATLAVKVFLFLVILWLSVVPHELGHALAGRLVGFRTTRIEFGVQHLVARRTALGIDWQIRALPLGGATHFDGPLDGSIPSWLRARWVLVMLGGSLANAVIAVALVWLWPEKMGWERIVAGPVSAVPLIVAANVFQSLLSLLPVTEEVSSGPRASDGLQLWRLITGRPARPAQRPAPARASWLRRRERAICRLVAVLAATTAGLIVLVTWLISWFAVASRDRFVNYWVILLIFPPLFLTLAVIALRLARHAWTHPTFSAIGLARPAPPTQSRLMDLWCEVRDASNWTRDVTEEIAFAATSRLGAEADPRAAISRIDELLSRAPGNHMLTWLKADEMTKLSRWAERDRLLAGIIADVPLSARARTKLMGLWLPSIVRQGEHSRVRQLVEEHLSREDVDADQEVDLLDTLASLPIMEGLSEYLSEADLWSQRMLALRPRAVTVMGTRGAILFELGRLDEAESMLRDVHDRAETDVDRGISALYLALLASRRGNEGDALRLARRALLSHPEPWLEARLRREVPAVMPSR